MTRRGAALDRFAARLAAITIAGGFVTDAGKALFQNETPELGEGSPDVALAMEVDDDAPRRHGNKLLIDLPIEVHALARTVAGSVAHWQATEDVLGDVKAAVEIDDDLGGLAEIRRGITSTRKREQGSTTVGVTIRYVLTYAEAWGAPLLVEG